MESAQGPPGAASSTDAASRVAVSRAPASSRRYSSRHRRRAAACMRAFSSSPLPAQMLCHLVAAHSIQWRASLQLQLATKGS